MIDQEVKIDWELVTAAGVTARTFQSEDHARAYLRARNAEFGRELPGAYVVCVHTEVTRARVYTPRLRAVA